VSALSAAAPARPRGRVLGGVRIAAGAGLSCLLGAALVFALVLVLPSVTGHRSLTVLSGSMEPTLETGSVVVDEVIHPSEARIGDIVTFDDPAHRGRLITHRLRGARIEGDTAHMVTQGDANPTVERWDVAVDGEIGRVVFHVPKLGHVRALIGGRKGYVVLMIAILLLGAWVLADVWRRPAEQDTEPTDGGTS
jgi:signal peptidase